MAAVKRLAVLLHSNNYSFYFLWDHGARSGYFENRITLVGAWWGRGGARGGAGGGGVGVRMQPRKLHSSI